MSTATVPRSRPAPLSTLIPDLPRLDGAACRAHDEPWIWFADEPEGGRETRDQQVGRIANMARAIAICRDCPARKLCEQYVADHPKQSAYGIWAGKTAESRGHRKRHR